MWLEAEGGGSSAYFINKLAWEPSVVHVTLVDYPHLVDFTRKLTFATKVDPLNWDSQAQTNNIPLALPSSPIKIWGKSVYGIKSYDRTYKQTNRQTDILYINIE